MWDERYHKWYENYQGNQKTCEREPKIDRNVSTSTAISGIVKRKTIQ